MIKRFFGLCFTVLLVVSLAACSSGNDDQQVSNNAQLEETQDGQEENQSEPEVVENMSYVLSASFGDRAGTYSGEVINGIPNGEGEFSSTNSEGTSWVYTGQFVNGQFEGEGKTVWDSGQIEEGYYKDSVLIDQSSEINVEPLVENQYIIGDYIVDYKGARLSKNYEGNDCIVITYDFTNNSDGTENFLLSVSEKVFQNGIELSSAFMVDDTSSENSLKDIRSGATIEVETSYVLDDLEADVEVDLDELISFKSTAQTFVIKLSELN